MKPSIITIGNGGYNIAADAIESGIFSDFKLIVCDSDADDLKRNSVSADRSFLLDDSVDKFSLTDNPMMKPIVDGVTDRIYIFAALGGMVTRINVPPLLVEMDAPRRFIWSIITMPSDLEGAEIRKRACQKPPAGGFWHAPICFSYRTTTNFLLFRNCLSEI